MGRTPLVFGVAAGISAVAVLVVWLLLNRTGSQNQDSHRGPAPQVAEPLTKSGDSTSPDPDRVRQLATQYQIPLRAMQAYARAEIAQAKANPSCKLAWNYLAGVAAVESAHGTLGGAGLAADGVPSKRILGPPLNGENGTRAIRATPESIRYTGDDTWDRAVGPFQFLTSSWRRYGIDADGDGEANPNDIDDAALGGARHLCADSVDLSTDDWGRAVYNYNNSEAYVRRVRSIAQSYAE